MSLQKLDLVDRKILSDIAVKYPEVFEKIVKPFIKK